MSEILQKGCAYVIFAIIPRVNPKHLFLASSRENTQDKIRKGLGNAQGVNTRKSYTYRTRRY